MQPKVTTLAPWFGSNRTLAHAVGEELRGCRWVGVPFAGGMSELAHIKASTIVVSDLHQHLIHLARVVSDPVLGPKLYRRLRRVPFHPWSLEVAQRFCSTYNPPDWHRAEDDVKLNYAEGYFVSAWMNRSAKAGTDGEFSGSLPVRWNANGGDSNTRYRSATASLREWRHILARCNFVVCDVFDFLAKCNDAPEIGVYLDPPFPGPGDDYKHKFSEADHRQLADWLGRFDYARVVCRFYDHPLVRELYHEGEWTWRRLKGRTQANKASPEVLITNRGEAV